MLKTYELERLKLLVSGSKLTTGAENETLDMLRSRFPNLLTKLGITGEKLKDNKSIIKSLSDPINWEKIKNALLREPGELSLAEVSELVEVLDKKTIAEEQAAAQPAGEAPSEQSSVPPAGTTGGSMPGGLPNMAPTPTASRQTPRVVILERQTEPPVGPATAKIDRLAALETEKAQTQNANEPAPSQNAPANQPETQNPPQSPLANMSSASTTSAPTKSTETKQEETTSSPSPSRVNFSSFKSSLSSGFNKVKSFASRANPFLKTNLGRIANGLKGMAGGLGRGIGGAVSSGLGAAAPSLGRAGNNLLGGVQAISKPGGLGNGPGGMFGRFRGAGGQLTDKFKNKGGLKFALVVLGIMLFVMIISTTTQTPQTGEAGPISGGGNYPAASIASCKFTRGAENPAETTFKSNLLLSYIQEASQKSGIPPVVLAAFIRVESPPSSNMTDSEIVNYSSKCAQSDTKALGIMQIQPPGTTSKIGDPASCDDCINAGAKLIGKTVDTMTREDYCDPRTSIIVGAGWILKRMGNLGLGDGTKWDPAWTNDRKAIETLVNTYYGGVLYPDYNTGPYNYATDVLTSIQNCQVSAAVPGGGSNPGIVAALATDCPIPSGKLTCGSLATPVQTADGPCGHCGIGYEKFMFNCTPEKESWGNKYALDIEATPLQKILLPKINGHIIKWTHVSDKPGGSGYIQTYTGVDTETQQSYLIQFQHTEAYSGNRGEHLSGERGANACSSCKEGHIHVQLGDPASLDWLDAAQYFCRT